MTQSTQTYTPTLMQKLLGRNFKWWYILYHSLISETGGKIGFLSGYFATVIRIVSTSYTWFLAGADSNLFTDYLIAPITKLNHSYQYS